MDEDGAAHPDTGARADITEFPDIAELPEACQRVLTELLTQMHELTPERAHWIDTSRDEAWGEVRRSVAQLATDASRTSAWENAGSSGWDAASDACGLAVDHALLAVARDTAHACVVYDINPDACEEMMRPWRAGMALVAWSERAPRAHVEIARRLRETWTGSGAELIETAEAALAHPDTGAQ